MQARPKLAGIGAALRCRRSALRRSTARLCGHDEQRRSEKTATRNSGRPYPDRWRCSAPQEAAMRLARIGSYTLRLSASACLWLAAACTGVHAPQNSIDERDPALEDTD